MIRPASEIHSSLEMVEADMARRSGDESKNLSIVRDVLRWVAGSHWIDLTDGENPWLVAYLLDDPPKIDNTPPEIN